jgi:hypothetical protein
MHIESVPERSGYRNRKVPPYLGLGSGAFNWNAEVPDWPVCACRLGSPESIRLPLGNAERFQERAARHPISEGILGVLGLCHELLFSC